MTSRAWVPIDPVLPSRSTRFGVSDDGSRGALGSGTRPLFLIVSESLLCGLGTRGTLADMELSYVEIGATRGRLPSGYHHTSRRAHIADGRSSFESVAAALRSWEVHRRAGLRTEASSPRAEEGTAVVLRLGPVRIPCRVVYVVDEPNRAGFAYGTLPGHPEQGEECFLVEIDDDGTVFAHIRAFSRPGTWYTKLGGPIGRAVQRWFTSRYVEAMRAAA
jgi:uncharacterized protein (UPF0548 family)